MDTKIIAEKVEDIFKKMGANDEEIARFYLLAMEVVTRRMGELVQTILNENDYLYLQDLETEQQSKEYVEQRIFEVVGKDAQTVSDEILREYLQEVQDMGYQKILEEIKPKVN